MSQTAISVTLDEVLLMSSIVYVTRAPRFGDSPETSRFTVMSAGSGSAVVVIVALGVAVKVIVNVGVAVKVSVTVGV